MTDAALAAELGRATSWVLAGGIAAFAIAEAWRPHAAFANDRSRVRHMAMNTGLWLVGFVVIDLLLLPRIAPLLPDPANARLSLLAWPLWAQVVSGLLLIDLAEWALHWLSHRVRPLWLLHAVHHSDPHVDVTTALRHHPLEALVAIAWQATLLMLVGLPVWIVLLRGLLALPITLYHHSNIVTPPWLDRAFAIVIVSPGMHRVHHSPAMRDANSNYGQMFSFWDRIFGTWTEPRHGAVPMYGLAKLADDEWQGVGGMLMTPLKARGLGEL